MPINKTDYQAVLTQVADAWVAISDLNIGVDIAGPANTFDSSLNNMFVGLTSIESWANAAIEQAELEEQEAVMNNFLLDLKAVFDGYYSAKLEVGSSADGYGLSYGEGETAVGIKLTATLNGVTSSKEINKSVILGEDLV